MVVVDIEVQNEACARPKHSQRVKYVGLGRTLDPARPPEKLMFSVTPRKLMLSAIVFFTSLPLITCNIT